MKFFSGIALSLLCIIGFPNEAGGKDSLAGEWSGQYLCGQGLTNFALSLNETGSSDSLYEGVLYFFPHASNPNVSSGNHSVKINMLNSDGEFEIVPGNWISRPPGYSSSKMTGKIFQDANIMGGEVKNVGCSTFSALKVAQNAKPSEYQYCVKESIRGPKLGQTLGPETEHCFNTKIEAQQKSRGNFLSDPTVISRPFRKRIR